MTAQKSKSLRGWGAAALVVLLLACAPGAPTPGASTPTPTTPVVIATPAPSPTFAPEEAALPDLKEEVFFTGGGGGGLGCVICQPVTRPTLAGADAHSLCLCGLSLADPFTVTLRAPGGETFRARYHVAPAGEGWQLVRAAPPLAPGAAATGYADIVEGITLIVPWLWDPVGLAEGRWDVRVESGAGAVDQASFVRAPSDSPAISVVAAAGPNPLAGERGIFTFFNDNAYEVGDRLAILGRNFAPSARLPLAVYRAGAEGEAATLVHSRWVATDARGRFRARFDTAAHGAAIQAAYVAVIVDDVARDAYTLNEGGVFRLVAP